MASRKQGETKEGLETIHNLQRHVLGDLLPSIRFYPIKLPLLHKDKTLSIGTFWVHFIVKTLTSSIHLHRMPGSEIHFGNEAN